MLCEFCSKKITIESQWYSTIGIYCQTPRSVGLLGWVSFRLQVYVCRSASCGQMGSSYLGLVLWTGAPRETNGSTEALIWCRATSTLHWQGKTAQLVAKPGVGNKYCPLRQKGGIFRISRIVRTRDSHSIYQREVVVSKSRRTFNRSCLCDLLLRIAWLCFLIHVSLREFKDMFKYVYLK